MHFIFIGHLLMLTYFCVVNLPEFQYCFWLFLMLTILHVQNVLIIFDWCLCDFLVLKHIDEVYTLHLHLSLTDVDIFVCGKYSTISILFLIIYWCWLFFMCKMFLSFLTDVYVIFCYWNISMKWMDFIFICHLLMLTFLFVKNILWFQYCFWSFTDVDYFSCAKCSYHSRLMFMWFSVTETYWWSGWTSSSFVIDIFFVWKIFYDFNLLLIIYWCWLFFMCKMFLSFSTDVYVIFLYWNISMQCTYFIFICHLLMLTYFRVENVPQFQYCFWLFTDVDYFSCTKCSYHVLIIFQNFNIAFDYLLILTIFHVPKFL